MPSQMVGMKRAARFASRMSNDALLLSYTPVKWSG